MSGSAGEPRGSSQYERIVWALFVSGFATFAQVFDVQAVLPVLTRELAISPSAAALTISATTLGIAISVLPWAALSDRIGRTAVLRLSLSITAVVCLVTPFLPTIELVIANRALTGAALGGVPAIAMTYLSEEVDIRRVAIAAGTYVSGNTAGGIAGRLIAGPLADLVSWRVALFAVAILGAISVVVFLFLLPQARGFERLPPPRRSTFAAVRRHLRDRTLRRVYALGFVVMGLFAALYNYLAFRLAAPPFGIEPAWTSAFFLTYFVGAASAQVSSRLSSRVPLRRLLIVGGSLMAIGLSLMAAPFLSVLITGLIVFTTGTFFIHSITGGLSGSLAHQSRAQSTALYQLSWLTGTAVLGWVLGLVLERAGWTAFVAVSAVGAMAAIAIARGVIGGDHLKPRGAVHGPTDDE